jgi:O-antigen/teichoic acid export membrane protein
MNGFSFMSLAYGSVASALFGVVCTNIAARRHVSLRLSLSEGRQMAVFGLQMMSIGGVAVIAARVSDIILGQILGLAALGLYSRASNVSNILFENIYGAVTRVIFVQLSNEYREKGTVRDIFLRSFEMMLAVMWPVQMGLAVLSGPVIYRLYGERWLGAAPPLSLLMIAQCIVLCFGMNWELFVIHNETSRQVRFEAMRAVAGVFTFTIGCLFSISAAAVGRIAEATFGLILYQPHMSRLAETRPGELGRIFLNSAGLTVAAVLPALVLMLAVDWSYLTSVPLIVGAVLVGVALWFAVIAWQQHPLLHELTVLTCKLLSRIRPRPGALE